MCSETTELHNIQLSIKILNKVLAYQIYNRTIPRQTRLHVTTSYHTAQYLNYQTKTGLIRYLDRAKINHLLNLYFLKEFHYC